MTSGMYHFLSLMWVSGNVTEDKLQTYVPKFITQEEKDLMTETPHK